MIDEEGNVWMFGENSQGQLGLGDTFGRDKPTKIENIKAISISCGYNHTGVIDEEGNVWMFGDNEDGKLGLGDELIRDKPEKIENIKARIVNDADSPVIVKLKFFLRYFDKIIKVYSEEDATIPPKSKSHEFGPFEEVFSEKNFPDKGKYTVVTKIVSLMDENKGSELDYKTKSFYLEEDPPMRGLFERCEAFGFPDEEEVKYLLGYSETGSERGLVLYYNLNHTAYTAVADVEDDLAAHILRIAGHELCRYDLLQENSVLFKPEQKDDTETVLSYMRNIIGELLYKFHKGEV